MLCVLRNPVRTTDTYVSDGFPYGGKKLRNGFHVPVGRRQACKGQTAAAPVAMTFLFWCIALSDA